MTFFKLTCVIYALSIILSTIFYSIFKTFFISNKKDSQKENSYNFCHIFGFIVYSQNIIKKGKKDIPSCQCMRLFSQTIQNCCDNIIFSGITSLICCGNRDCTENLPCCCTCCCLYNEDNFDKNEEFFCFCYQEKRKQKWFNIYISNEVQKKLVPFLFEYFLLQLMVIGFENDYQQQNINSSYFLLIFIIGSLLFFYISISFYKFIKSWRPDLKERDDLLSKISNSISDGAHGILIFNSVFTLILSSFNLSNKNSFEEIFISNEKYNNIIFIPIIMNKFYYFTLMYYCISYSEDKKGQDLMSGSTLISIYLFIWDLFYYFLKRILKSNLNFYIFQICISAIPSFITFIGLILGIIFAINFDVCIMVFICFCCFLCGGGFCLNYDDLENIYYDNEEKETGKYQWLRFENWICCKKCECCQGCCGNHCCYTCCDCCQCCCDCCDFTLNDIWDHN